MIIKEIVVGIIIQHTSIFIPVGDVENYMKYKLLFQEEKEYDEQAPGANRTYMDTIHEVSSSDSKVMAVALRGIAQQLDPASNNVMR